MDITQEKIDLINKVIKANRKYVNNEDLYDDFFNETYKRSLSIINEIDAPYTLEAYLRKIATTSMIAVLKNSGRIRRTNTGFVKTEEISIDEPETVDYSSINISYSNIKIPETPEDIVIQKELLEFVAQTVRSLDKEEPKEEYLKIYTLRYDRGLTQKEIAEEIGISQSEVSKRLYNLLEKVRITIE